MDIPDDWKTPWTWTVPKREGWVEAHDKLVGRELTAMLTLHEHPNAEVVLIDCLCIVDGVEYVHVTGVDVNCLITDPDAAYEWVMHMEERQVEASIILEWTKDSK